MEVEILRATSRPVSLIGVAAGLCYGKTDPSEERVARCIRNGHLSVMEHASVTVLVSGVSRNLTHQLVRHRIASFNEQSQRYVMQDVDGEWYVTPDSLEGDEGFERHMDRCAFEYMEALRSAKREDARYVLPGAAKTRIVMTVNARELMHMLAVRTAPSAQWEIRRMFEELEAKLSRYGENAEWPTLMRMMRDCDYGRGRAE